MFAVFYELAITARKHAKALGSDVSKVFTTCGVLTLFIWLLYPIAWGVSEGGNVIAPDSEAVFYGILDFCAKPVSATSSIYAPHLSFVTSYILETNTDNSARSSAQLLSMDTGILTQHDLVFRSASSVRHTLKETRKTTTNSLPPDSLLLETRTPDQR